MIYLFARIFKFFLLFLNISHLSFNIFLNLKKMFKNIYFRIFVRREMNLNAEDEKDFMKKEP